MSKRNAVAAPDHLSERSQTLWRELQPEHARSVGRQTLLRLALESLDRIDEIKGIIAAEGYCPSSDGKMPHLHPLLAVEKEARRTFLEVFAQLGCHWNFETDSPV